MDYSGPNGEWDGRFEQVQEDLLRPLAQKLEMDEGDLQAFFLAGPFSHMLVGFAFEEYATVIWDNEERNLIDAYLAHRGWREAPAGRRYLQALADSELRFWEVSAVKPGAYADIRPYGSQDDPIRVKEKAATESLNRWDGLAARVLRFGGSNSFSGAMLPFRPELAARVQSTLSSVEDEAKQLLQELIDRGEIEVAPSNLEELLRFSQESELAGVAFVIWAMDVYLQTEGPAPSIRNMDGDIIAPTSVRFPLRDEVASVSQVLDASPILHRDSEVNSWTWFPKPYDRIHEGEQIALLGHLRLSEETLVLEVNSESRAERGKDMLTSLLGSMVGSPLTVYDNSADIDDGVDEWELPPDIPADVQAVLTNNVTAHYRKTLDEPVPALNGLSPRHCAANPELQPDVVRWLKQLENSNARSRGAAYDFQWMWDELNLERQ